MSWRRALKNPLGSETRFLAAALVLGFVIAFVLSLWEPSVKDIASSISIEQVKTMWVPWHPPARAMIKPWETFVAPRIIFRVRNKGKRTLRYVAFNAVFLRKRTEMKLGTAYLLTLREGLKPGEVSEPITMTSDGGYAGTSLKALQENPFWEPVICRLYVVKGEKIELIGTFDVENTIEIPAQNN